MADVEESVERNNEEAAESSDGEDNSPSNEAENDEPTKTFKDLVGSAFSERNRPHSTRRTEQPRG